LPLQVKASPANIVTNEKRWVKSSPVMWPTTYNIPEWKYCIEIQNKENQRSLRLFSIYFHRKHNLEKAKTFFY